MWHTDAIDTFDNYFGNSSSFYDSKNDTWITSITLSHWGFKKEKTAESATFDEGRDSASFPPKTVMLHPENKKSTSDAIDVDQLTKQKIEEGSSSLVISGDILGNFWTCSVISSMVPEAEMNERLSDLQYTITDFIHQACSGRCLVFLSFLGMLCESLAKEYDAILERLTKVIKLGVGLCSFHAIH